MVVVFMMPFLCIEYCEEGIDQILGKHMCLVHKDSDLIVHHNG